jgi:flagellar biosynthesis protein FlhF
MQVKKFCAKTIKAATSKVKRALGPNAMIISMNKLTQSDEGDVFEIAAVPSGNAIFKETLEPMGEIKSELMSIKEMICLVNHSGGILEKLILNPAALNLYAQLITNGVNDQYARLFLEKAGAFNGHAGCMQTIKKRAVNEIVKVIKTSNPFDVKNQKRIIAAFIGTTGVGKTTTIAKLAAQLMLKGHKKVGLISIDTYRIGALEQLKTYANILGVPCFQAFKSKDLLFALRRMEERDVILIDTAGQSQYDLNRIEELQKMIPDNLAIDTHLLLSVATTESEMNKTAVNFSPLKFQSYIFTKTDEAQKFGSALNQIMKLNLPVSYITTGQNVPEDIEPADKRMILNLLLNKSR